MFSIFRSESAMAPVQHTWEQADAPLRKAILSASRSIDQQLQVDPLEQGESRDGATRVLFEAPVAVAYEVDEPKKLVRVVRAWIYRVGAPRPRPGE
jgi:hypothetical protein